MRIPQRMLREAIARLVGVGRGARNAGAYLGATGAIGGIAGGLQGGAMEAAEGGDFWEGAEGGARSGALMGPLAVPAVGISAATGNPFPAAAGLVPWTLIIGSEAEKKRRMRELLAERMAFERMTRDEFADQGDDINRSRSFWEDGR